MLISIAQFNPRVGDFSANLASIAEHYEWASAQGAHLLLCPELSLVGYLPLDLIDRPEIFSRCLESLDKLKALTEGKQTAIAVGWVRENPSPKGRAAENAMSVILDGKIVFTQAKTLLPTYDVFDEARYFEPATEQKLWTAPSGEKIIFAICEDLWGEDPHQKRALYGMNPVDAYEKLGGELLISLSASPYEYNKQIHREALHARVATRLKLPVLYLNQVGATDEILYDGQSFALDAEGKTLARLPHFRASRALFRFEKNALNFVRAEVKSDAAFSPPAGSSPGRAEPPGRTSAGAVASANSDSNAQSIATVTWSPVSAAVASTVTPATTPPAPTPLDVLLDGIVLGIRDYFRKTGFSRAILGLSGGIDSALVAALAVKALGRENVTGIAMPSQYSSGHSLEDAEGLARNLGIRFEVRPIKFLFSTAMRELGGGPGGPISGIAEENTQSRLRGLILMTLANQENSLVLTTGNKSEMAMGYCTLYGDMCGALAPIGDVLKTRVYALSELLNERYGEIIPRRSITKAPSAELKPGQTDQDSLPPYPALDDFLEKYLEQGIPVSELEKEFSFARDMLRKLEFSEYKRKQAAPVLKVTPKAFGVGRRVPIAKFWDR